jgi:putative heme-binding domain-containing protein
VAERLLATAGDEDRALRQASLESLRRLKDTRAVQLAVAAIDHPDTQLAALAYLRDFGGPEQLDVVAKVARSERSIEGTTAIVDSLSQWKSRQRGGSETWHRLNHAIATVHGGSDTLLHWSSVGPISSERAAAIAREITAAGAGDFGSLASGALQPQLAGGRQGQVVLAAAKKDASDASDATWLSVSDVFVPEQTNVQFLASSRGALEVWLNRDSVARCSAATEDRPKEQFEAVLSAGLNRLLVQVSGATSEPQFHLRFRRISSRAEHEQLMKLALESNGNAERGGDIFRAAEKSQCVKCHRIGDLGGEMGPDLSGVGSRFSRVHLIESILEPSRTIAPSYHSIVVLLKDGRIMTGVKLKESDEAIVLGDSQGKEHSIFKKEIGETFAHPLSAMPEGLEKGLSDQEFVDLIAFLLSQTNVRSKSLFK